MRIIDNNTENMVGLQQTPIPSDDSLTTASFGGLLSKASLQAKLSSYSDPKSSEPCIHDLKWSGSDKTICNPMLLPDNVHVGHPPMSHWTLKDCVIGAGDVSTAVQSSAISPSRPQRVSAAASNNCIKCESVENQNETTKERKCLEATAVTAPVPGYHKFELGDDTTVDVDIEKEKRKRYHREYYARRKKRKVSNVAHADVSHDIDKNKDFAVERRKEYNKEYYARQKKLREVKAKGNTESWQYPRINNSLHSAKKCAMRAMTLITNNTVTSCDMGEFNTEETHVRADKASQKTSCYSPELNTVEPHVRADEDAQKILYDMGQLNTKETQASASDNASQKRKVYNRAYYLRNKNKIRTGVDKLGGCQTWTSTATTITVLNITGKERVTQVMFGLD